MGSVIPHSIPRRSMPARSSPSCPFSPHLAKLQKLENMTTMSLWPPKLYRKQLWFMAVDFGIFWEIGGSWMAGITMKSWGLHNSRKLRWTWGLLRWFYTIAYEVYVCLCDICQGGNTMNYVCSNHGSLLQRSEYCLCQRVKPVSDPKTPFASEAALVMRGRRVAALGWDKGRPTGSVKKSPPKKTAFLGRAMVNHGIWGCSNKWTFRMVRDWRRLTTLPHFNPTTRYLKMHVMRIASWIQVQYAWHFNLWLCVNACAYMSTNRHIMWYAWYAWYS